MKFRLKSVFAVYVLFNLLFGSVSHSSESEMSNRTFPSVPETRPQPSPSRFELLDFRGNFLAAAQFGNFYTTSTSYSGQISYVPAYRLSKKFDLRLDLGWCPLLAQAGGIFSSIELGAMVGFYGFKNFVLEAGGGEQFWTANKASVNPPVTVTSNNLMVMANVGYQFPGLLFSFVDRVFLGFNAVYAPFVTYNFKAGLQVNF